MPDEVRRAAEQSERTSGPDTRPDVSRKERQSKAPDSTEREPSREGGSKDSKKKASDESSKLEVHEQPGGAVSQQASAIVIKDPITREIEDILSEGLAPLYRQLSSEDREKLRTEGERTASKLRDLIESVKIKTKTVLRLIKYWLQLIPGVNRFFLEQEAKIKSDKVMVLHDRIHNRR